MNNQLPTTPFIERVLKPAKRQADADYKKRRTDIERNHRAAVEALLNKKEVKE